MPDKKLTDTEIKKALEDLVKCNNNEIDCGSCSLNVFYPRCPEEIGELSLDLINRLQAENERLKTENKLLIDNDVRNKYPNCVLVEKGRIYTRTLEDYDELIGDISAEAYNECIEKAKESFKSLEYNAKTNRKTVKVEELKAQVDWVLHTVIIETLDNILKELVGNSNES